MRKYRLVFLAFALIFFLLFYLFSRQVKLESFKQVNFDTTVRFQDKIPERFGELFEDAGALIAPVPSIIIVFFITALGFITRKGIKSKVFIFIIPVAFALLIGAEVYGKAKVESPAPPFFMLKNPTTLFPKYHVQEHYSYPSGHSARALFLASSLLYVMLPLFVRRLAIFVILLLIFLFYILFISVGKIYLGHHWLSDIIGGWILGIASFLLVLTFLFNEKYRKMLVKLKEITSMVIKEKEEEKQK